MVVATTEVGWMVEERDAAAGPCGSSARVVDPFKVLAIARSTTNGPIRTCDGRAGCLFELVGEPDAEEACSRAYPN